MPGILQVAVSGLNNAAARVANAANNIANASSAGKLPAAGEAYKGFTPTDVVSLSNAVSGGTSLGVVTQTQPRAPAYNPAFDPSSPSANADGFIAAPNVDLAAESVSIVAARANYAANAAVVKTVKELDKALLDIKT